MRRIWWVNHQFGRYYVAMGLCDKRDRRGRKIYLTDRFGHRCFHSWCRHILPFTGDYKEWCSFGLDVGLFILMTVRKTDMAIENDKHRRLHKQVPRCHL